jgi:hypothetical protein
MFKKHFKIVKEERVTGILPYHIQERYTIFFFIHWWGTPTFAPPHLHQTYKEAYNYIKKQYPNAIIDETLRDKCVREYGEHFGELYDRSCRGETIGNLTQTTMFLKALEKIRNDE